MLAVLIVLLVALAGCAGAPWWTLLLAAASLTMEGWWAKLGIIGRQSGVPWSSKITTYFVTGVLANVCFSALSFGLGRLLRWWLIA